MKLKPWLPLQHYSFAKDIGASSIILEGNFEVLIFKALFCDNASFASFGHLIDKTIFFC